MQNLKKLLPFIIVLIFFIVGFFLINNSKNLSPTPLLSKERGVGVRSEDIKSVIIAGQSIKVDLALTSLEQTRGLSGRQGLKENEGMLFIFADPGKYYFWMKDMNFRIDIIWLTEDMRVIYIKKNAEPETVLETFGPDVNAKYVLEVVSGFSDENNLKVGDSVQFGY